MPSKRKSPGKWCDLASLAIVGKVQDFHTRKCTRETEDFRLNNRRVMGLGRRKRLGGFRQRDIDSDTPLVDAEADYRLAFCGVYHNAINQVQKANVHYLF